MKSQQNDPIWEFFGGSTLKTTAYPLVDNECSQEKWGSLHPCLLEQSRRCPYDLHIDALL
jgi:hypothetical protein